jgi:DNA-directed RNA polymerase specialized sigma24 family protein
MTDANSRIDDAAEASSTVERTRWPELSGAVRDEAQAAFTAVAPDIHRLAHHFHRRLHGEMRDEAVAETEAFAWKAFCQLVAEGRDPVPLVSHIVDFAARRVREGRRFAGKVYAHDALPSDCRHRQDYFVTSLPHADDEEVAGEVRDALQHRVAGPAEEAISRMDWEAFLQSLPDDKYRDMAVGLAEGFTQAEIGARRGVSGNAAQQMVRRLRKKYAAFHEGDKGR